MESDSKISGLKGQRVGLEIKPHSQMIIFVISHRDKNSNPNQMLNSQHELSESPSPSLCQSTQLKQNLKSCDVIEGSWELVQIYCRLPLFFSDIPSVLNLCFLLPLSFISIATFCVQLDDDVMWINETYCMFIYPNISIPGSLVENLYLFKYCYTRDINI